MTMTFNTSTHELRGQCSTAQVLQDNFRRLSGMLAAGLVKPLPSTIYDISELDTALRQFSHARHIGKIVVTVPATLPGPAAQEAPGAWAVTGGLGALGLITAEWLAGQGARHIHLLGRSGRWVADSSGTPQSGS